MRPAFLSGLLLALLLPVTAQPAGAQQTAPAAAQAVVPPLVKLSGTLSAPEGPVIVTFALYADPTGGEPLWTETQTISVDANGRYTVLLGATQAAGVPPEIFAGGRSRWIGVGADGQPELPRILLTSVPYALKAADAETIAGRPLSAFVLAGERTGRGEDGLTYVNPATLGAALGGSFAPTANAGTANYLGKFTNTADLGNSAFYQAGTSIGLNTLSPEATLHVKAPAAPSAYFDVYNNLLGALPVVYRAARGTPTAPAAVQVDDILGGLAVRGYGTSGFSLGRGQVMFKAAENWTDQANGTYLQLTTTPLGSGNWQERMRIDPAGNVGIGTATPAQKLSVAGTIQSTTGGFKFPDGTTQTTASSGGASYSAGAGLSLASNVFSVTFGTSGTATTAARSDHAHASYVYTAGTGLSLASGAFSVTFGTSGTATTAARSDHAHSGAATLGANTFTAAQTLTAGNVVLPWTTSPDSGVLKIGSRSFLHNFGHETNTFVGSMAGGAFASTGPGNTGVGQQALAANGAGVFNTAVGMGSLVANVAGNNNTAVGAGSLGTGVGASNNSAVGTGSLASTTTGHDNVALGAFSLYQNTTGINNTAVGASSLNANTVGIRNTAMGYGSLYANTGSDSTAFGAYSLTANSTGLQNSAFGTESLMANIAGHNNTAVGYQSLAANTESGNTAVGAVSLKSNTTGSYNTAVGAASLSTNDAGHHNSAFGAGSLAHNIFNAEIGVPYAGSYNSAVGFNSLWSNTWGFDNSAFGALALQANVSGGQNVAVGSRSLTANTEGSANTAVGYQSMERDTEGFENTAVGYRALASNTTGGFNTAIGSNALWGTTGSYNIGIGMDAGGFLTTGDDNIVIGGLNYGQAGESGTIRLGRSIYQSRTFIAGIRGVTTGVADAIPVFIDSLGQLGTASSSRRVKDDVTDMGPASSGLMQLRPVTFHYKSDQHPTGRRLQYGLIAEEVAEIYPGLVTRTRDGQVETVMYQFLPPMLLNEVQKQQRLIDALNGRLSTADEQARRLAEQVSAMSDVRAENALLKAQLAALSERLARLEKAGGRPRK